MRDRIVLYALKEILSRIFPECIPQKLANTCIYGIRIFVRFLSEEYASDTGIIRAIIENLYGSLERKILLKKLKLKRKSRKLIALI